MAYAIRTQYNLQTIDKPNNSDYIKQIYIKNKSWNPEPAPLDIEDKITNFEKQLKNHQKNIISRNQGRNLRNLTYPQSVTLRLLKLDDNLTIKNTDKNLGPAIMETEAYIVQVLKEHLLTKDYVRLSEVTARHRINNLIRFLKALITENYKLLSKAEVTYFQRSFKKQYRIPIFYGLPKVHKTPVTLRPVVSSSSSFLSVFSVWLDLKMKDLLPLVKSYIKNSMTIINDLKELFIPDDALIFTADAKSMYTNIDTATGVAAIRDFIIVNRDQIPADFPTDLFLQILTTVMENNIFTFAGTYWQQLSGTAMGTPAACAYATITFGQHENNLILPTYHSQLIYYKRYIDDIFAIWLPPERQKISTWNKFKEDLNNWGSLEWAIEEPSLSTTFLDLNLQIIGNTIKTSTYQKPMNLYLYIPPKSSHPPSCLKGLISGELRRYFFQNSTTDFQAILTKFIWRLVNRGHTIDDLTPLLLQAASNLDRSTLTHTATENPSTLFLHWTYHPNGLQRQDLRKTFDSTFKDDLPFDKMQVAVARPKNLRDVLTRATTKVPAHTDIDHLITQCCPDQTYTLKDTTNMHN
jgi:hypothetical protein